MKRIGIFFLGMALLMSLAGCGNGSMVKQSGGYSQISSVKDVLQAQIDKEKESEAPKEEEKEAAKEETKDEPKASEPSETSESARQAESSEVSAADARQADIDLTIMSATMIYSEVYNMMNQPEDYIGKVIKIEGQYAIAEGEGIRYDLCIIKDATACCAQGMEFCLTEDYVYPDAYPNEGDEIVVMGTFETYMEGEYMYCTLRNAVLLSA
ncbi:MAG: hypothetical protein IKS85_06975 [Lachnospiraceae bacterium]|nr:hypothetical protein [Lachnospiraceae bacterium]